DSTKSLASGAVENVTAGLSSLFGSAKGLIGAGQEKVEEAKEAAKKEIDTSAETENTILGSGVDASDLHYKTQATTNVIAGVTAGGKTVIP
uniref:Uncharacterized protein n=1 Tax=Panagrolaimus sp. ES5 TaxID=591445 RepID=A0AC34G1J0_9BILA